MTGGDLGFCNIPHMEYQSATITGRYLPQQKGKINGFQQKDESSLQVQNLQTYWAIKSWRKKRGVLADITLTNEFTFGITQPRSMLLWKHTS